MSAKSSSAVLPFDLWSAWDDWVRNLLAENRMPLSGDVKQWIKAWGEVVGQVGLFNVKIPAILPRSGPSFRSTHTGGN